jgi:hypothetical protein
MKYQVQTAIEEIEAEFPDDALHQFLHNKREVVVIVEEADPNEPTGWLIHEYFLTGIQDDDDA